jgi:hypothetical protein
MSGHIARIKQEIAGSEAKLTTKTDAISARLTAVEGNISL